jgi:glutamyl-tRNA(Gln) amidotransferase subunit E
MRPLPGSARMYPETDVKPIAILPEHLKEIKSNLPEPFTNKIARFKAKMKLSHDLAEQIVSSEYLELFESITKRKRIDPSIVANTFTNTIKDLRRREKLDAERLKPSHFVELFENVARKSIVKEAIPDVLKYLAANPDSTVKGAVEALNLEMISKSELQSMVSTLVKENPEFPREKILGIVMSRVRGKANSEDVMAVVKRFKKK